MPGQSFEDLIAWQKAIDLVAEIYAATRLWPKEELYGLTSQIRRAAVSVPSNIAEGQGRRGVGDFRRFLAIARGSLAEVETQLVIAARLGYCSADATRALREQAAEVGRLLSGLIRSLSERSNA